MHSIPAASHGMHGIAISAPLRMHVTDMGGMQVVAFQATMEMMAENFPGAFAGYSLEVIESHQRSKVDTSGTAKAVVSSFQQLGLDFQEVRPHPSALPDPAAVPLELLPAQAQEKSNRD